jgi:hypothetical protein
MSTEVKSKEQIEKENEIATIVKSLEEAGKCACKEICVSTVLGVKEARKTMSDTKHKCKCDEICLDDVLGSTSSYVRELSKPPYTDWSGVLTCPATSVYADRLTEFKPEKIKEGADPEKVAEQKEKNQKKGVRFTHAGQEYVRGWWASPEPEFWLGRLSS